MTEPAIRVVADMLDMPYIRVLEVATFYTHVPAPAGGPEGTCPGLRHDALHAARGGRPDRGLPATRIAAHAHELSDDGDFSWEEVECLGACVNAPMVQVFSDTYEDLTAESFEALLDTFARGGTPKPGPQVDRLYSAPEGGPDDAPRRDRDEADSASPPAGAESPCRPRAGVAAHAEGAQRGGRSAAIRRSAPRKRPPARRAGARVKKRRRGGARRPRQSASPPRAARRRASRPCSPTRTASSPTSTASMTGA